jgi:hypothetical protein
MEDQSLVPSPFVSDDIWLLKQGDSKLGKAIKFTRHITGIRLILEPENLNRPRVEDRMRSKIADMYVISPLKTKRRPLYLKTQSVPRCKHFSSGL